MVNAVGATARMTTKTRMGTADSSTPRQPPTADTASKRSAPRAPRPEADWSAPVLTESFSRCEDLIRRVVDRGTGPTGDNHALNPQMHARTYPGDRSASDPHQIHRPSAVEELADQDGLVGGRSEGDGPQHAGDLRPPAGPKLAHGHGPPTTGRDRLIESVDILTAGAQPREWPPNKRGAHDSADLGDGRPGLKRLKTGKILGGGSSADPGGVKRKNLPRRPGSAIAHNHDVGENPAQNP